ncbi:MAG: phosphatase PAP2 family protein [Ruminococcaceae bacterium]|nr:phosphatase PAP2 family protein [Oscillospiraceae bacterium]
MSFLYFLESIRNPILDAIMSVVTMLGEETIFLGIALLIFWCLNKKRGYIFLLIGFVGITINQILKLTFRIPRPWVKDPNFTVVESAVEEATGYSFPSGHTQNVADTFGCVAYSAKRTWVRIASVILILLVGFSRMYLGVHTPLDVVVSLIVGAVLVLSLYPLLERLFAKDRNVLITLCITVLISVGFVLYTELFPFPADIDPHNLASGQKNAYTMLGCSLGLLSACIADQKWLHFKNEAPLWGQVGKLAVGAGLALAIKAVLKAPLLSLFGGHASATALRYFLVVVFAGIVWPLSFPLWAKLGRKKTADTENA